MITVRIPDEIRKYKEKIMFGLTARQLIATVLDFAVCIPLYLVGRRYISDDILSWMIILISAPVFSIGYFHFNGLPMEKFIAALLKFELLYPHSRIFKTVNAFRQWQDQAIKEDTPKPGYQRFLAKRQNYQMSLERAVLAEEADENGRLYANAPLLTAQKSKIGVNKSVNKRRLKENGKSYLQKAAEARED
ncbi:MAG: PrgI family protein, partial [Clostridiales bacterium]|nr:PrgI family protein [Clostridiales bacterium]